MRTPRQIAEAFSGHRFRDVYDALAPDVRWTSVGKSETIGRQAVIDTCEATLAELSTVTSEFVRFFVIADGDKVAVEAVGRYTAADGTTSAVSSCDLYAFADCAVTSIRSYAVEINPASATASG